jgi:asparagine synthase (glutamine-hydrolysing)
MKSPPAMALSSVVVATWKDGTLVTPSATPSGTELVSVLGDVRLDAEVELAREVGAVGERGLRLVARAYERWHSAFAEHLVGDFAIVVIDRAAGLVVAARDAFGVRRLAYRPEADGIALSADVGALAALGAPRVELDEAAIGGYLAGEDLPNDRTLFHTVFRVPPGHTLIARPSGVVLRRHFVPSFATRRGTREESVALIRARLVAAVADRVVGRRPVVIQVSGGVDSGAIACLADEIDAGAPRHFFSAHFRGADETRFVDAIDVRLKSSVHVFDAEPSPEIDDLSDPGHPARYVLAAQTAGMNALAARTGAEAVLSGIGGDELFFERGVYRDLAAYGHWRTLYDELTRSGWYASTSRRSYARDALRSIARRTIPGRMVASVVARARARRGVRHRPDWLRPLPGQCPPTPLHTPMSFSSETQRFTWEWLTSPRLVATLEAEDRTATSCGLQMRYPFLDSRLSHVVLSTPYGQRLPGGRMKALLRDAAGDSLPDVVRARTQVTSFDAAIAIAIARKLPALRAIVQEGPWRSDTWVVRERAAALLHRVEAGDRDIGQAIALWDVATLELWLRALG